MPKFITELKPNEVFVFGSNSEGFSCSGSAGLAVRGPDWKRIPWRDDPWVWHAIKAPVGHKNRIGHWGVWGIGRGWSQGKHGMSYAVETVRRAGAYRSTPIQEIEDQLVELLKFTDLHYEWRFLHTEIGSGLGGWTKDEMAHTLRAALKRHGTQPRNLVIPEDLYNETWT